jgi:hypothetical protein
MADTAKPMTPAAFTKLLTELCAAHGRLWLTRQDDGALVVSSRTSEPVSVMLTTGTAKR